MGLVKTALIVIILSGVLKFVWKTSWISDWGKSMHNHAPGPCRIVEGVENGSEDIQTLSNGLAFITSGLKFLHEVGSQDRKHVKGKIYLFNFNSPEDSPTELKLVGLPSLEDFTPHGLSLWPLSDGGVNVYVINHLASGDQVEKFAFDKKKKVLNHIKSIKDESFRIINDLVAIGEDQFYVTNYLSSLGEPGWTLEREFYLDWGQIVFFDGARGHVVAGGMNMPNGINISPDNKYVFVAGNKNLQIYTRETDNTLALNQVVDTDTRWDNIDVNTDDEGHVELWIGAHPIRWQFQQYFSGKRATAPSQVLRVVMDGDKVGSITEIYADNGHRLYGSSVANRYKSAMLVGSVKHKLMYCQLHYSGM